MTRFIHDQFSKDYLETLLQPYGDVTTPKNVAAEVKEIDLWFTPKPELKSNLGQLGLLGKMAETTAIFEPFRNAVRRRYRELVLTSKKIGCRASTFWGKLSEVR